MKTNLILLSIFILICSSSCKKSSTCDVGIPNYTTTLVGKWQVGNVVTTYNANSTFKDSSSTFYISSDTASGTWKFSGYYLIKTYYNTSNYPNGGFVGYDVTQLCPTSIQMEDNNFLKYSGNKLADK